MNFNLALTNITDKSFDNILYSLYTDIDKARDRYIHLLNAFKETFGTPEEIEVFSAPGRTEIGGNHTDHQNGHVLAASINRDAVCAISKSKSNKMRMFSDGFGMCEINLSDLYPNPKFYCQTSELLRGMASGVFSHGYEIYGLNIYINSQVLPGSGLSSSAALEMALGVAFNSIFCNGALSPLQIAQIGQYAENKYYGKPCGLMDEAACIFGDVIAIDFGASEEFCIERIDADFNGFNLIMIDSGANHAGLTEEYASIRNDMNKVASFFKKGTLSEVPKKLFIDNFNNVRCATGDLPVLRALHFYGDDERAILEAQALKNHEMEKFLAYVNASGRSSFMYLNNVTAPKHQANRALAVTLALCDEYLNGTGAFRVHGGGFAGTAQAFVPENETKDFIRVMNRALNKDACHVLNIRKAGGLQIL